MTVAGTAAAPAAVRGAVLLDLDGTVIDSMPLHGRAWKQWHAEQGLAFDDDAFFAATAGRTNAEILRDMFPAADPSHLQRLASRKEALYREAAAQSLQMIPGFGLVHAQARAMGLGVAICTASPPENIAVAVVRFGIDTLVDTIVSPADGLRGKPHPDLFEEAARRLGVEARRCLVFEDAPLGVESARRAGMLAVALTTSMPAAAFAAYPNCVAAVPDFLPVDLTRLPPFSEVHHA